MLYLIGTGLGDYDITKEAEKALSLCDAIMVDGYTAAISDKKLEYMRSISDKSIRILGRTALEEDISKTISEAKSKNLAILVNGDPLIATTHKTILIEARKNNIDFKVLHSTSVLSVSMAESGLDFYRFGPICTIPRWSEHYKPVSFYETVLNNIKNNQHSIMLLDYDNEKRESIRLEEALTIMRNAESHYGNGIMADNSYVELLCDLGTEKQKIKYCKLNEIDKSINYTMATLILPAKLSDIENEYLKMYETTV